MSGERDCPRCVIGTVKGRTLYCISRNAQVNEIIRRAVTGGDMDDQELSEMTGLSPVVVSKRKSRILGSVA